jgi:hypothetical protein
MVCGFHQIDGMFVYIAYIEVFVGSCMFTFVSNRIIIEFLQYYLLCVCVEIAEYVCLFLVGYWIFCLSISSPPRCIPAPNLVRKDNDNFKKVILTRRCSVRLKKLTVPQLVKKFSTFYVSGIWLPHSQVLSLIV